MNIRPVKKDDLLKLIEIEKSVFDYSASVEDFINYFNEDTIKIWKVLDQIVVGFIVFYRVKDEIEIIKIGIMKSCQRKNYGSLIINKIKKLNNIKKIFLEVSIENTQAINFYLKNGFKKINTRQSYYKHNETMIDAALYLMVNTKN